jgi:protein-tyrosine phosphatase
MNKILEDDP